MRQQQMMKIVHGLSEAREQRVLASSFHRFAAYNHEALYWSFRNVVTLRVGLFMMLCNSVGRKAFFSAFYDL